MLRCLEFWGDRFSAAGRFLILECLDNVTPIGMKATFLGSQARQNTRRRAHFRTTITLGNAPVSSYRAKLRFRRSRSKTVNRPVCFLSMRSPNSGCAGQRR